MQPVWAEADIAAMRAALEQARQSAELGEIPVGAVVVVGGEIGGALHRAFDHSDFMAQQVLAPLEHLRSDAFLGELRAGGVPPEQVTAWSEQVETLRGALGIVFPAIFVIGGALMVLANAALLRLYLARRDPGWLEDGEFERVRWPLGLVGVFILSGAAVLVPAARATAYNVLLVVAFFFALQGLAVVGFYARRLAGPPLLRTAVVPCNHFHYYDSPEGQARLHRPEPGDVVLGVVAGLHRVDV